MDVNELLSVVLSGRGRRETSESVGSTTCHARFGHTGGVCFTRPQIYLIIADSAITKSTVSFV